MELWLPTTKAAFFITVAKHVSFKLIKKLIRMMKKQLPKSSQVYKSKWLFTLHFQQESLVFMFYGNLCCALLLHQNYAQSTTCHIYEVKA